MTGSSAVLRQRVLSACRDGSVGLAAGVQLDTWASTTTPRVFSGLAGMMGGRNRGRLPFLEVEVGRQTTTALADEGGTLQQQVTVRCHVGDTDPGAASDLSAMILGACAASIRSQAADNLTALGDDEIGDLLPGPFGLQRDLTLTVEQSFSRSDYGVT